MYGLIDLQFLGERAREDTSPLLLHSYEEFEEDPLRTRNLRPMFMEELPKEPEISIVICITPILRGLELPLDGSELT